VEKPDHAPRSRLSHAARRRGFVLVTMIASIVVLLAVVGLAIDSGRLQLVKVRMQNAADAAALAAVQELKAAGPARVSDAAVASASSNGFASGVDGVGVTIRYPPASGYYTGDVTAVEVNVEQRVGLFFLPVLGVNGSNVRARSVARRGPGASCVHVLDPAASGALSASGGVIVQVNCGVVVDSASGTALKVSGGAGINATSVEVAGGYAATGGGVVSPEPAIHQLPDGDPLAWVAAPAVGGCTDTNFSPANGAVLTISQGVYCNGMSLSGGATVRLRPGTYILKGGGLKVSGGSTLIGSGVTFYNTAGGGLSYGAISLSGGATVQLSAPTSGPLAGMLFFQDRGVTGGAGSTITGGATSFFEGALYFPTTALLYSGGATTDYTILVARQLTFTGGTLLNSNYTSLASGTPVKGNAILGE